MESTASALASLATTAVHLCDALDALTASPAYDVRQAPSLAGIAHTVTSCLERISRAEQTRMSSLQTLYPHLMPPQRDVQREENHSVGLQQSLPPSTSGAHDEIEIKTEAISVLTSPESSHSSSLQNTDSSSMQQLNELILESARAAPAPPVSAGANDSANREDVQHCPYCDFKAFDPFSFRRHVREKHDQSKRYQCLHCSYSSPRSFNVKTHMASIHAPHRTAGNRRGAKTATRS